MATKKLKPYSVLLLYPEYISQEEDPETFYAFVRADDNLHAITKAQRRAGAHNREVHGIRCGKDFHPLLVLKGHHRGEPTEA